MLYFKITVFLVSIFGQLAPSECQECPESPVTCARTKYRSIDGSCNNVQNPQWGMPYTRYGRLAPQKYGDGVSSFALSKSGKPLPLPRSLSIALYPDVPVADKIFTLNAMQFGQIVTHDMSLTVLFETAFSCCSQTGQFRDDLEPTSYCHPVVVPENDPVFSRWNQTCIGFVRTATDRDLKCAGGSRSGEQLSQVTSFMDLSVVYGNNVQINNQIRKFQQGLLRTEIRYGQEWPLTSNTTDTDCPLIPPDTKEPCYFAADDRVNQNPQLTVLQIILHREHNRIARQLSSLNKHWTDEVVFQETRKILIAQYAQITYYEWLPLMVGEDILYKRNILHKTSGQVRDYDEQVYPGVLNEHANAAFKHFHSTIAGRLDLVDEHRNVYRSLNLSDWYFRPKVLEENNNFDALTRGLNTQPQMASDTFHDKEVTNYLFKFASGVAMDLKAIDIQRNRDHGLASYNDMRKYCGFKKAITFKQFRDHIPEKFVTLLQNLYEHPDDVDLIVGGSLERLAPGALVGPVFRCILLEQFRRTRVSDRFWFENDQFTPNQLKEIRKSSISRLLCDNTKHVKLMQRKGFVMISKGNPLESCDNLPVVNLTLWKEIK